MYMNQALHVFMFLLGFYALPYIVIGLKSRKKKKKQREKKKYMNIFFLIELICHHFIALQKCKQKYMMCIFNMYMGFLTLPKIDFSSP